MFYQVGKSKRFEPTHSSLLIAKPSHHAILHLAQVLSRRQLHGNGFFGSQRPGFPWHVVSTRTEPSSVVFRNGNPTSSAFLASYTTSSRYARLRSGLGGCLCQLAGLHHSPPWHVHGRNASFRRQPQRQRLHTVSQYASGRCCTVWV